MWLQSLILAAKKCQQLSLVLNMTFRERPPAAADAVAYVAAVALLLLGRQ